MILCVGVSIYVAVLAVSNCHNFHRVIGISSVVVFNSYV